MNNDSNSVGIFSYGILLNFMIDVCPRTILDLYSVGIAKMTHLLAHLTRQHVY